MDLLGVNAVDVLSFPLGVNLCVRFPLSEKFAKRAAQTALTSGHTDCPRVSANLHKTSALGFGHAKALLWTFCSFGSLSLSKRYASATIAFKGRSTSDRHYPQ